MQETFGQRLRRLLEERHYGKPLSKIAKEAGVDLATLQKALDDETDPRFPTKQKLAAYCQVSVEYLMTGEGLPDPSPADLQSIRERLAQIQQLVDEVARDLDAQAGNGQA